MWDYLLSLITVYLLVALVGGVHVLLYKRNSRSAFGWLGLIILFPIAGALLYALFGVNRVRRKARRISLRVGHEGGYREPKPASASGARLEHVGRNVTRLELMPGNRVSICHNGEEAFPSMLEAIDAARREVLLSSYIFDNDATGRAFTDALARARQRGCRVCVLIDDVGIRYSFPTIVRELKKQGLSFRRFMPLQLVPPQLSINMRNHRKLLIADRRVTFAGGMNIGDRQLFHGASRHRASDLHFRFDGPINAQFVDLFAEDWKFAGGAPLDDGADEEPANQAAGEAACRLIPDGPDETLDALMLVIMGAIASARKRAWIMTPYFLPERQMMGCLQAAALAGVDLQVMIPQRNNWPLVQWALQHNMAEMLDLGVRILQHPPPLAHSKCLLVDDEYALVGSANLDPRSLRLNFELGIEVFDPMLNQELAAHFEHNAADCIPYTQEMLRARRTLVRLRDAGAALFGPYL
ncbi:MAG: phospholipase D-like domain-containing protein [Xanthomonadales bacterium]|nr:phospholipase D-like domain-containing protein [Xanthomonadales bacterium]